MFGFIKMLERIISKLRSNKRLWFTSIFIISVTGIALSILILISTTDRITHEVYLSQAKELNLRYKDLEKLKEKKLHKLAIVVSRDNSLIEKIEKSDTSGIVEFETELNAKILNQDKELLIFKFYTEQNKAEVLRPSIVSSMQTKNSIFGAEVLPDGIFYIYLFPLLKEDKVIGLIEVRESIYTFQDSFARLNQEYAFLLDTKMLPMLSLQNRDGIYQDIGKNYLIHSKIYNSVTLGIVNSIDENSLLKITKGDYIVTKDSFLNGMTIRDINGVEIGLAIMGQSLTKEGGFINMAQKMTHQVIAIALGLIVSLLLFLC